MKKLIYLFIVLGIFATYSCGSGTDKGKEEAKEEKSGSIKDCDDFLAYYEEWVDDYIMVIDDYMNNPSDEIVATRYMELMTEAIEWSTKWVALVDCADNEKYEARFEEISKEIEKKLEEIGL